MRNRRRTSTGTVLLVAVLAYATLGSLAFAAVQTNTLEAGNHLNGLIQRIRLALDPPPDREVLPIIEVTQPGKAGLASVEEAAAPGPVATDAGDAPAAHKTPRPRPARTPRPPRRPVDVKLHFNPRHVFASQVDVHSCAIAGTQIVLAMHGILDNSGATQQQIASRTREWESRQDSHNGGWGPSAIASALAAYGLKGYEIRAYATRQLALRDAAIALSRTRSPVVLIAWRGAHTWVMTGYRAKADPTVFPKATITGAYIYDPWYPRISTIWGPSDPPGAFQDEAEMIRNYLPWKRPEGSYKYRDGKFLAIVPTVPRKEQRALRS
jgi:hypothetical protein